MKKLEARIDQLKLDNSGNDPVKWIYWNKYYDTVTSIEPIYLEGPYEVMISKAKCSTQKTLRSEVLVDSLKNFRLLHTTDTVEIQSMLITTDP